MDWISFRVSMVLILATAAIYSAFPVLFAWLRKSEINRKTYRVWCVVITALIALVFSVFTSLGGGKISFSPAVLWGGIFYNTGIKILRDRNLLTENSGPAAEAITSTQTAELGPEEPAETFEGHQVKTTVRVRKVSLSAPALKQDTSRSPELINTETKKKSRLRVITLALGISMVATCAFGAYQSFRIYKLEQQLTASEKKAENCINRFAALREDLRIANEKANFLDERIAIVTETGEKYHTYDCQIFKNTNRFWAYNTEAAEALGYAPCSLCHP